MKKLKRLTSVRLLPIWAKHGLFFLSFWTIFLLGNSTSTLSAQPLIRQLTTNSYMQDILQADSNIYHTRRAIEQFTHQYMRFGRPEPVTIPIVFHILYSNAEELITLEQVQSQMDVLNSGFGLEEVIENHPNDPEGKYLRRAADTEIDFCFPLFDPLGNFTTGIEYFPIAADDISDLSAIYQIAPPFDTEQYLNVWVAHLPDSISGYAQMPGGPLATDGIVIDYRYFGIREGEPYGESKTLHHLIGNYLNLYPLWGDGESCSDDYVDDTPIHNSPNTGLDHFDPTTGSGSLAYQHVSTCYGDTEMVFNFMDNGIDNQLFMFTRGQKQRMHATLSENGPRSGLATTATECDNNLQASDVDFRQMIENDDDKKDNITLNLFPNPTSDGVFIQLSATHRTTETLIEVYSTSGQLVYSSSFNALANGMHFVATDQWLSGVYVLFVRQDSEEWSRRLTVNR